MENFEQLPTPMETLSMASEKDIETLIGIEQSVPKTKIYSPMLSERAWKEELATNTVMIISRDGEAIGSIAYEVKSDDHIYISGLIIKPEFQGQGIGTKVMRDFLKKYSDTYRIDLVTHPENPALHLYESLGFKIEYRKENYFGDGEPRLVLARTKVPQD